MQRPKTTAPSRGAPPRPIAAGESEAARRLRRALAERMPAAQVRNHVQIGSYMVDLVALGPKLIVEIGVGETDRAAAGRPERRRTAFLEARGYRILRFSTDEVTADLDACVEKVAAVAGDRGGAKATKTDDGAAGSDDA
ncbi:endonuclease domain-containing protein [Lutibaculum baratangense]|uniref:DUF559 domain-containing protein n=1 Tax=Lutibaculum baratangense AMV1 TaxID=631454 RepID=V4RF53_9HYPH|nr:DUF559 domain-containing protein [Lutibaculum baratangense]ESR24776.1 hypothetical protein N177_2099 [Lutibaculum baratangense AMV1]